VAVISPAGGSDPEEGGTRLAEFAADGIVTCPEGQKAWGGHVTRTGTRVCAFDRRRCDECPRQGTCPAVFSGEKAELRLSEKAQRLSRRREYEKTAGFGQKHGMRSGIEATNSCADRISSIKRLRHRRARRLGFIVHLKITGLNFWRVSAGMRLKSVKNRIGMLQKGGHGLVKLVFDGLMPVHGFSSPIIATNSQ
jgi:hypothetical protein